MRLSELKFVVFDVETTGLEPESGDRIVEIAALKSKGEKVVDRFHSLINPKVPVSAGAFAVNGITLDMLKSAPRPSEIIPKFVDFIKRDALFAYNANFDAAFLAQELKLLGENLPQELIIIDILAMARSLVTNLFSYKLESVAKHLGYAQVQKHRALEDVKMSFFILQKLFAILKTRGRDDFLQIKNLYGISLQNI
ncbi:MAG: 3'-5' exonuclease [Candidatus Omnitrophota bacterium]